MGKGTQVCALGRVDATDWIEDGAWDAGRRTQHSMPVCLALVRWAGIGVARKRPMMEEGTHGASHNHGRLDHDGAVRCSTGLRHDPGHLEMIS